MTFQEFRENFLFDLSMPLAIGDLCYLYIAQGSEGKPYLIQCEQGHKKTGAFQAGNQVVLQDGRIVAEATSIGQKNYKAFPLEVLEEEQQQLIKQIQEEKKFLEQKRLSDQLLLSLDLANFKAEETVFKIKEAFLAGAYEDAFQALTYFYKDQIDLDEGLLFMLGYMCYHGKGTLKNIPQATIFLQEAQRMGSKESAALLESIKIPEKPIIEAKQETTSPKEIKYKVPSVQLQLRRYAFVFTLGMVVALGVIGIFHWATPSQSVEGVTEVQLQASSKAEPKTSAQNYDQLVQEVNTLATNFSTYQQSLPQLNKAKTMIDEALIDQGFTNEQMEHLKWLKNRINQLKKNISSHEKGIFWKSYKTQQGETALDIAARFDVITENIRYASNQKSVPEEQAMQEGLQLSIGVPVMYFEHEVVSGDNLGTISKKYNITWADIKELNDLDGSQIQIGQRLKVFMRY
ncbi:LysM peptidoglycan-binding domain-containing protein [Algivirga pacifica]|uniref:LysM domain-containing protein n=1 Tax=Algivirga pacifica TaxID=1162670 RepID=A0ABP9D9A3_9BACT